MFIHTCHVYVYIVSVCIVAAFEYLKSHPVGQIDEQEFSHYCGVGVVVTIGIRESIDSLCRDGANIPRPPYIGKACTRPNLEDLGI